MKAIRAVVRTIDSISRWTGRIVQFLIFILTVVMVYEVIARYVFNAPTIWAMELSGYLMTVFVALGGAYVLLRDGHINVDVLYSRLNVRKKATLDVFTSVLFFLFLYFFFTLAAEQAIISFNSMQTSGTIWDPPIWPLKILVAVGVGLVLLQGVSKFIRNLVVAITGTPMEPYSDQGVNRQ